MHNHSREERDWGEEEKLPKRSGLLFFLELVRLCKRRKGGPTSWGEKGKLHYTSFPSQQKATLSSLTEKGGESSFHFYYNSFFVQNKENVSLNLGERSSGAIVPTVKRALGGSEVERKGEEEEFSLERDKKVYDPLEHKKNDPRRREKEERAVLT